MPISKVVPLHDSEPWFVRKMQAVLEKQGQIEPLQVHPFEDKYITFPQDSHGADIVFAARNLGWDTLLVHVTYVYEE